ncbi:MAG: transporter substrate-binding domain-containing protein [Tabrizicola sp.]|nr:transporter substrate-binding domain-containing protein [Tabrizicola sp.]
MACISSISALIGALTLVSAESAVIGSSGDNPPFTDLDGRGEIIGIDRDIGDELCRRTGLRCSWVRVEFDQLIPSLLSEEIDIAISGLASSREREKLVAFTVDYLPSDGLNNFVGRAGAPPPDAALIGVQSGTIQERHLIETNRRIRSYPSQTDVMAAAAAGEVDLVFGPFAARSIGDFFETEGLEYLFTEAVGTDGPAVAVCKGNGDLLERLDTALSAMIADGTIDRIDARWD